MLTSTIVNKSIVNLRKINDYCWSLVIVGHIIQDTSFSFISERLLQERTVKPGTHYRAWCVLHHCRCVLVCFLKVKTRSFAIAKRTACRLCLVDLVHCQHCFLRHMGYIYLISVTGVYPVPIKAVSHVAQSCYSVIGDKPFLWSKPKFDPP